jgi:RNA polymerase sigma-70 factor (ECF subfamily)
MLAERISKMEGMTQNDRITLPLDEEDRSLLRAVCSGEERALEMLYEKYGQRLYSYAYRICGDPRAAEDVLQDTLVITWQNANRFRGQGRVIAWMLGIVNHQALKTLRHPTKRITEANEEIIPSNAPLPEEIYLHTEYETALKQGLEHLSLEHRTALELIFYQKLSYEEAAAVCHCPVGTIKSRVSQAKKQLKGSMLSMSNGQEESK